MKHIYLTLISILFLFFNLNIFNPVFSIEAGITYNEASAKVEAFKDIIRKIDKTQYKDYLVDPDYKENMALIEKQELEVANVRSLCPFYLKSILMAYGVVYDEDDTRGYYYDILGNLLKFDIINKNDYPRTTTTYSRFGNLIGVTFEVNENEQFVFNKNGVLKAHWIDNRMLDKNGKKPKLFQLTRGFVNFIE